MCRDAACSVFCFLGTQRHGDTEFSFLIFITIVIQSEAKDLGNIHVRKRIILYVFASLHYTSYIKHYTLTARLDAEGSSQSGKHCNGDFQDFTPDGFVFVFHGYCFFYFNAETRRNRELIILRELSARSFLLAS